MNGLRCRPSVAMLRGVLGKGASDLGRQGLLGIVEVPSRLATSMAPPLAGGRNGCVHRELW
jgi:hypothetical protein